MLAISGGKTGLGNYRLIIQGDRQWGDEQLFNNVYEGDVYGTDPFWIFFWLSKTC